MGAVLEIVPRFTDDVALTTPSTINCSPEAVRAQVTWCQAPLVTSLPLAVSPAEIVVPFSTPFHAQFGAPYLLGEVPLGSSSSFHRLDRRTTSKSQFLVAPESASGTVVVRGQTEKLNGCVPTANTDDEGS